MRSGDRLDKGGKAGGEAQTPDRGEVGGGCREQLEAVALGLRRGVFVGEDLAAARRFEAEGADDAEAVAGVAALVEEVVGRTLSVSC